jgi:hypothetical protein
MQGKKITNIAARRLMQINEQVITVARRRPAIETAGYTLQSPPYGGLL